MNVFPVLDLLNGVVVRGVGGKRENYRPVESRICGSAEPFDVARAFRDQFGLTSLYVADLDAILEQQPNLDVYRRLTQDGFKLLVDAGIRTPQDAIRILEAGAEAVIAGLESVPNADLLSALVREFGSQRMIFSLDLKQGRPLVGSDAWLGMTPLNIAESVIRQGVERLIVLDLGQVGIGEGISTLELCAAIRAGNPSVELITGGGIRDRYDLQLLADSQLDGVLVASALHNGSLSRDDLRYWA